MIRLLIDLSRYIFVFNIFVFLVIGYILLLKKEEKRSSFLLFIQAFLVFINHMTGSFCLMASRQQLNFLVLPVIEIIIILSFVVLMQALYPEASRLLTNDLAFFLSIGLTVLSRLYYDKAVKQFVVICFGFLVCFFVPLFMKKINIWSKLGLAFSLLGIFLLSSVIIQKTVVNGSMLTLTIGRLTFQPSEFVKIIFCLGLAGMLVKATKTYQYIVITLLSIFHVLVLVATKDLGTAAIFYGTLVIVLYVASRKKLILIGGTILAMLSSFAAYYMFAHVRTRVSMWLNPWSDIDGKGYQTTQSLFAVCSGNLWGFGLDGGAPLTIPYVEQDFIFSAICEEFGAIFGCLFILLCLHYFLEILNIAKTTSEKYLYLLAMSLGFMYLIQIILTIGGNINFIPMTGVTLNFTSYGGSSCLCSLIIFSFIQSVAIEGNTSSYVENEEGENKEVQEDNHRISNLALIFFEIIFSLITISMAAYLIIYVNNHRVELIGNSYNAKRKEIISRNIERGAIYTCDKVEVAYSSTKNGKTTRYYPFDNIYSHVVGYETLGGSGIEKNQDTNLMTSNITVNQWVEDDLNDEKHKGNSVVLTINSKLQEAAVSALGIYDGAIIAMDPSSGEILCMVSKPDFNPNTISENWEKYLTDTKDSCLVNRATNGLYPPGSTFKILTALEYMRENENTDKYSFNCNGYFAYEDNKIKCYHGSNHGVVDFNKSFAKSCNSSFANIGVSLDFNKFRATLNSFYFGKDLGLDLETKISTFSESEDIHSIMQTSIGQGETLVTPIHLAMITATIANGGKMVKPYLVSRIESYEGTILKQTKAEDFGQIISSEEALKLKELMIGVVEEGTATKLKDQKVKVAGKTGSAEFKTSGTESHAWFTCFTYDTANPIVVTVIMEDAGSGGEYAVPVARQILDVYYNTVIVE